MSCFSLVKIIHIINRKKNLISKIQRIIIAINFYLFILYETESMITNILTNNT